MTDEAFQFFVFDDLSIDVSSTTPCTSVVRVRWILLEGPFELVEALSILVELGFQLTQLRELCGLVVVRRQRISLSFMPRSPRVSVSSVSSVVEDLHVIRGSHSSVYNVEAFPHEVVAIGLGVRVWLRGGVETSPPLFRQLLSQRGEHVASWSQRLRPAYLRKAWAFS
jgi:hypothetical protein